MKKIGIVGWSTDEKSFGVTKVYLQYLSTFGQVEIITPSNSIRNDIDLLILPGGDDMSSSLYGEIPSFMNTDSDLFKEYFFVNNLKYYIEYKIPIFGICLGFQQLNVYFGGKLTQHLPDLSINYYSEPRNKLVHSIDIEIPSMSIKYTDEVNSLHHQGVLLKNLGDKLNCIAKLNSGENILVEAFMHEELPIAGVQWHPEYIYDELSKKLINYLLNYSKK
jgi:putative glutamine amidotransferase